LNECIKVFSILILFNIKNSELLPEFLNVANSWDSKDKRVYFAILDYHNGKNVFKQVCIW